MLNKVVFIQDKETGIVGIVDEVKDVLKVRVIGIEDEFEGIYGTVIDVSEKNCVLLENVDFTFGEILYWHARLIGNKLISCVSGEDRTSYPVCKLTLEELKGMWKFKVQEIGDNKLVEDCDFELEDSGSELDVYDLNEMYCSDEDQFNIDQALEEILNGN